MKTTIITTIIAFMAFATTFSQETTLTLSSYDDVYANYHLIKAVDGPGSTLIKARDQIITGVVLGMVGKYYTHLSETCNVVESGNFSTKETLKVVGVSSYVAGALFAIIGLNNIGRAGVEFNKYGVGISIPIK